MRCPINTPTCRNFETISSGFGRLFAILGPPFPKHSGGPVQWGRLIGTVAAANEIYECKFTKGGAENWLGSVLAVKIDASSNTAHVVHGMSIQKQKGWFPAKIISNDDKRTKVSWEIPRIKDRKGQGANLSYRVSVLKSQNRATVSMYPEGYENTYSSNGSCVKKK